MVTFNRPSVTFLAFAQDLAQAITDQNDSGNHVRSLARALAQQGWQVDWFTGKQQTDQPTSTWIDPHCRLIQLPVALLTDPELADPNRQIAQLAQKIQSFQLKAGMISPLFHSFDAESAQIGAYFKQQNGWRWIHTPARPQLISSVAGAVTLEAEADQLLFWQWSNDSTVGILADAVSQKRRRYCEVQQSGQSGWEAIATHLSALYRQHLAVHVGAAHLEIPKVHHLPVPNESQELFEQRYICPVAEPQYSYIT